MKNHYVENRQRATASDVAQKAGVSVSAVSRVFTPGASVSAKMRDRVMAAATKLDYMPNAMARSLMTQRSGLIGIILANFHNPLFLTALDLFTSTLQQRGLRMLVYNVSHGDDVNESARHIMQYAVDGLVVAATSMSPPLAVQCARRGIPLVSFARRDSGVKVNSVCADNVAAGYTAARTLIDRGYQRLGFLGGPEVASTSSDREKGFLGGLKQAGLTLKAKGNAAAYTYQAGHQAALSLLKGETAIDGIFCANDLLAFAAMDVARYRCGLRVPEDLGIIGFDDIEASASDAYSLTTIRQPIDEMVRQTIDLVTAPTANEGQGVKAYMFPCSLTERASLRPKVALP